MKNHFLLLLAGIILSLSGCVKNENNATAEHKVITDDLNKNVVIDSLPKRVISLAPNLTELIYKIGAGNKLIGNTLYCNYPEEAKHITKIGDMITFDYEKILSLKPDLVFITVEGNVKDSYEKLLKLGVKVFVSNPRNYSGIKKTIKDFGNIFNLEKNADQIISDWDIRYKKITDEANKLPHRKALFIIGLNPVIVAGKNTFINEIVTTVGLENIASDSPLNYPIFSREEVLKRDPEFMLMTGMSSDEVKDNLKGIKEWKTVKALKNNNVIVVDPDMYLRPGSRFIDAIEDLFRKINPHHQEYPR
ncbi:MAG: cobalamin-binding protein [Ignavibacteriales bacterium]|nr:MAG: cobalamin-binding protein [Ignavibacteriales bacterium]